MLGWGLRVLYIRKRKIENKKKKLLRADSGFLMVVLLIQCLSGSCQWHASPFLLLSSSMSISSVFALAFLRTTLPLLLVLVPSLWGSLGILLKTTVRTSSCACSVRAVELGVLCFLCECYWSCLQFLPRFPSLLEFLPGEGAAQGSFRGDRSLSLSLSP